MIYTTLFYEFFKIGLLALGGGLVTIPFLFDLAQVYDWFTSAELVDMIAVAESSPGPIGVNMATYAGYKASGVMGAVIATLGLVLPSMIIIIVIASLLSKYKETSFFHNLMYAMRPAVIALILNACIKLGKISLEDASYFVICAIFWGAIHFYKLHPIAYIIIGGILGIVLEL